MFNVFLNSAIGESSTTTGSAQPPTILSPLLLAYVLLVDWADTVVLAVRLALGGPLVGIVVGVICAILVGYIFNDPISEIAVTVIACYASFLVAEGTPLHVSGVLAVVFGGLMLSFYGKGRISAQTLEPMHSFWEMCGYLANTLIFFVAGLIMAEKAFNSDTIGWKDVGYLGILYVTCHIIRAFVIFLCSPILKRGSYPVTLEQMVVMSYSGLRGAVGLTLALIVEETEEIDLKDRDRILFHVAGLFI